MKRILATIGILVIAIVAGVACGQFFESTTDIISSPNGLYRVELRGDKSARIIPIGENKIKAEMFSANRRIGKTIIHYADFMDTSFELTYQRFRWDADNILGFHGISDHAPTSENDGDSLTISNKSSKRINFLNVVFGVNRFLVLELEPNASQRVYVNHSMGSEWIAGEGEFENGPVVPWKGVNFYEKSKDKNERLFRYCLTVKDSELLINSVDLEGGNLNPTRITPKVSVCGE